MRKPPRLPRLIYPLALCIAGLAISVLLLAALKILNTRFRNGLLNDAIIYFSANLGFAFAICVLFSYSALFSRYKRSLAVFAPILRSVAGVLTIELIAGLFCILANHTGFGSFRMIASLATENLFLLFLLFGFLGYIDYTLKLFMLKQKV
jgi:hypothetical protein